MEGYRPGDDEGFNPPASGKRPSFFQFSVIPLLFFDHMFLENYSSALVGLLGCMALVQQGYSACIPSYRPQEAHQNHSGHRGWRHSRTSVIKAAESTYSAGVAHTSSVSISLTEGVSVAVPTIDASASALAATETASIVIPTASVSVLTATSAPSATATSGTSASKGSIMIPWYLYPAQGAWTPMEELYGVFIASYYNANSNLSGQ